MHKTRGPWMHTRQHSKGQAGQATHLPHAALVLYSTNETRAGSRMVSGVSVLVRVPQYDGLDTDMSRCLPRTPLPQSSCIKRNLLALGDGDAGGCTCPVDEAREWQHVPDLTEEIHELGAAVLGLDLGLEAVQAVRVGRLVVAGV